MSKLTILVLLATVTSASSACGGSDSGSHFDEGDGSVVTGGSGGSGGTSSGGSSTGGANAGGSSTGGTSSGGTSSGGANTGGGNTADASTGGMPGDGGLPDAGTGGTSSSDGGTSDAGPDGDIPDGTATIDAGDGAAVSGCAALAICCPTSGVLQQSCETQVATGDDVACELLVPTFCGSAPSDAGGVSDGGVLACAALDACCPNLTGQDQAECEQLAQSGIPFLCEAALGAYQAGGLCN